MHMFYELNVIYTMIQLWIVLFVPVPCFWCMFCRIYTSQFLHDISHFSQKSQIFSGNSKNPKNISIVFCFELQWRDIPINIYQSLRVPGGKWASYQENSYLFGNIATERSQGCLCNTTDLLGITEIFRDWVTLKY